VDFDLHEARVSEPTSIFALVNVTLAVLGRRSRRRGGGWRRISSDIIVVGVIIIVVTVTILVIVVVVLRISTSSADGRNNTLPLTTTLHLPTVTAFWHSTVLLSEHRQQHLVSPPEGLHDTVNVVELVW
jgi:hypothetical protein